MTLSQMFLYFLFITDAVFPASIRREEKSGLLQLGTWDIFGTTSSTPAQDDKGEEVGKAHKADPEGKGLLVDPGDQNHEVDSGGTGHKVDPGDKGRKTDSGGIGHKVDPGDKGRKTDPGGKGRKADSGGKGRKADPGGKGRKADPGGKGRKAEPGGKNRKADARDKGHKPDPVDKGYKSDLDDLRSTQWTEPDYTLEESLWAQAEGFDLSKEISEKIRIFERPEKTPRPSLLDIIAAQKRDFTSASEDPLGDQPDSQRKSRSPAQRERANRKQTLTGEIDRLLNQHKQNRDLIKCIGKRYYQIIYPVQLRHHEKVGISTREINPKNGKHFHRTSLLIKAFNHKFRLDLELNTQLLAPNLLQKHYLGNGAEQISVPGIEHCYYHGVVKDYPGAVAAFQTCNGVSGVIHIGNETFIIHPFYGGDLARHPHVIFESRTRQSKGCANLVKSHEYSQYRKRMSGLHDDDEASRNPRHADKDPKKDGKKDGKKDAKDDHHFDPTNDPMVDHLDAVLKLFTGDGKQPDLSFLKPFLSTAAYGSTTTETPTTTTGSTTTATTGSTTTAKPSTGTSAKFDLLKFAKEKGDKKGGKGKTKGDDADRNKRDVREATKYVETALVLDKSMFTRRNGSTRADVIHDAIQIANIADLYYRQLNTRISLVYIETWQGENKIIIDKNQDISRALLNFNDYTSRNMFKIDKDTTQLLTGIPFAGGESGMAVPEAVCTTKAVGISVDENPYEPHILAATMAHMIGHNIGMGHDDGRGDDCLCRDWHGCLMAQSITGLENVQPYRFSDCSKKDYEDSLRIGHGICLLNKPNEFEPHRTCGNGIVEEGEMCDCGTIEECHANDPCCDPITCKLTSESECASGPCCSNCRLKSRGVTCRDAANECDLPEHCNGEDGFCPVDVHKKNGTPCADDQSVCFNGFCPTLDSQCRDLWGYGGKAGESQCYEKLNSKGSITGHCGVDEHGNYIKCKPENAVCGTLQCQLGQGGPAAKNSPDQYSRTFINIEGDEFECKSIGPEAVGTKEIPPKGLVRDGTPCGSHQICVNQTCTSLYLHIDSTKCPSNDENLECSGHGICNNLNQCYCNPGWGGPECAEEVEIIQPPTEPPDDDNKTLSKEDLKSMLESQMQKKVTAYGGNSNNLSTLAMVFILVGVVKGVFICFALMAVCCRRGTMPRPQEQQQQQQQTQQQQQQQQQQQPVEEQPLQTLGRSLVRKTNSATETEETCLDGSGGKTLTFGSMPTYSREHHRVNFRSDTEDHVHDRSCPRFVEHRGRRGMASGSRDDICAADDSVSFIEIPPSNLSKLPEKGILKKPYGSMTEVKEKWSEDSQSDSQDFHTHDHGGADDVNDMSRALTHLNGYHENILDAIRTASTHSTHRGPPGGLGMHTPSGSSSLLSEEAMRKGVSDRRCSRHGSQEKVCEHMQTHTVLIEPHPPEDDEEDQLPPSRGPIRIRNLEDLVRQLEVHSTRHMSPIGSEDLRMSETEADRHYRVETSDPQRHPTSGTRSLASPHARGRGYLHPDGLYETADPDQIIPCPEIPDENIFLNNFSDPFMRTPQQPTMVRSASAEMIPVAGVSGTATAAVHRGRITDQPSTSTGGPTGRDFYPTQMSDSSDSDVSNSDLPSIISMPEYKH